MSTYKFVQSIESLFFFLVAFVLCTPTYTTVQSNSPVTVTYSWLFICVIYFYCISEIKFWWLFVDRGNVNLSCSLSVTSQMFLNVWIVLCTERTDVMQRAAVGPGNAQFMSIHYSCCCGTCGHCIVASCCCCCYKAIYWWIIITN